MFFCAMCIIRSDEMEIIMADLDRANEVSFTMSTVTVNNL